MSDDDALIREDTGAWFEMRAKIWPKDRGRGLIKPKLNYLQNRIQEVIARMEEDGLPVRIIGLKPRQKGSTTYFAAADYCHLRRNPAHACVIGGQYSQTTEIWEMLKTYAKHDTFNWGNTGEINEKAGNWTNGSRLKPETAKDVQAGISGTYQVLHATEVARWSRYGVSNAADVLANILKCVPLLAGTMITLESTAEGAAGDFYTRWLNAVDAEDYLNGSVTVQPGQYIRVFAPWFEFDDSAMRLTPAQKLEIERTLDDEEEYSGERQLITNHARDDNGVQRLGTVVNDYDVWEQLAWRRWAIKEECKRDRQIFDRDYPASWQEAFTKSGNLRFNITGLSLLRKGLAKVSPEHGIIEFTSDKQRVAFRPTERGESQVIIFEKPTANFRYIVPIDPMTGITQVSGEDPDWHSVFALRAGYFDRFGKWRKPATAARIVSCRWDIDVLEEASWRLARYYGGNYGCKIVIEMNQDRGITELLKLRGADLYIREFFNQREQKVTNALGYQTNTKTREVLIERLAEAIREHDKPQNGIDIWDEQAVSQCENLIVKPNGRSEAAEGFHDDDVFAIGLGLQTIEHATTYCPPGMFGLGGEPPDFRDSQAGTGISPYS